MEKVFSKAEHLASSIKEYVITRIESAKFKAAEKSSAVIANILAAIIVVIIFFFFLGLASVALAFGLGVWIGKTWAGFLLVACLYLLIGIVAWTARGRIIRLPVMNALIKLLFRNNDEEI
jgi:uncharacterized membrane protein YqjE